MMVTTVRRKTTTSTTHNYMFIRPFEIQRNNMLHKQQVDSKARILINDVPGFCCHFMLFIVHLVKHVKN